MVIPTIGRWARLERTLRCALAQRGTSLEVIVVDDGSPEAYELDRVRNRLGDRRVRGIRLEERRGHGAARNAGIAAARGTWLAFLDDDDLWAPDKLSGQLAAASGGVASLVYSGVALVDDDLRVLRVIPPPAPESLARALLRSSVIPAGASNVLVRRTAMEAIGGFDERLLHAGDWDAWIRLIADASPAADPAIAVAYVNHRQSYTVRNADMVRAESAQVRDCHRKAAAAAGVAADAAELERWLGATQRRAGRRASAARLYARSAVRHRDPGSLARAVHAALGLPDPRARRAPDLPWLRELRASG